MPTADEKKTRLSRAVGAVLAATDGSHGSVLDVWGLMLAMLRATRSDGPISSEDITRVFFEAVGGGVTSQELVQYVHDTRWDQN